MSLLTRVAALRSHLSDTGESLPDLSARLTLNGVREASQVVDNLESEAIDGICALQEFAAAAKRRRAAMGDQVDELEIKVDGWLGDKSTPEIVVGMADAGVEDITAAGALEAMQALIDDDELPADAPDSAA